MRLNQNFSLQYDFISTDTFICTMAPDTHTDQITIDLGHKSRALLPSPAAEAYRVY
jgi:hypothetical protein